MYVIRRIAKAQPGKVWQVANLLIKICAAYEENGRPKAQVYVSQDLPGTPNWPSPGPRGVRFGTPHRRAAGPSHPPRPYPGDERRQLPPPPQPVDRHLPGLGRAGRLLTQSGPADPCS